MLLNKIYLFLLTIIIASICLNTKNYSQDNPPRLSPKAFVGQTVGYTDIVIKYGRPGVKERKLWGELVPYNEVWRTGANEATTIEFSSDVKLNGHKVPAGKYSLFTIPTENEWIIIINKVDKQWGAFKYDEKEDLLRFKVKPQPNKFVERLNFSFSYIGPYTANIIFEWARLNVSFEVNSKQE